MFIHGKTVFVYDIEVFPNFFSVTIKNTESQNIRAYQISQLQNDMPQIAQVFLNKNVIMCGYNSMHYDAPCINYILLNYNALIHKPVWEITAALKDFSDLIITSETSAPWKKYKYAHLFEDVDLLTMHWSEKLRPGLKALQVTMQFRNVEEYSGDFSKPLPITEIPKLLAYNENDVNSTEEFLNLSKKDIDLRVAIEEQYGVNVLSMDGVSIGKEILKTKYLQDTGKTWNEIKDLRSPCEYIPLKDVILPSISYETPILQNLLSEMKELTLHPGVKADAWNKTFEFFGTIVNVAEGGIHSVNEPEVIIPKEDEMLIDWDAASLYPSLLISYGFYPRHLGQEFLQTYSNIRKERIEAKHNGNKVKNETLKLCLNSVTGLMQNEYSWMYSPLDVYKIRMNGQLLLLKLAEMLILKTNCRIVQYNTDGIFVLLKKAQLEEANKTIKEFEDFSKLSMEGEEFEAFYQYAINDYIAVQKGWSETHNPTLIKQKGLFIDKPILGKGLAPLIIPEALNKYFIDGTNPEETIRNCDDIKKFCTYQKVAKEFFVEYNGELVRHINRFYMSTNGGRLIKYKLENGIKVRPTNLCADSAVTIYNTFDDKPISERHINYQYYIHEVYKIIHKMTCKQLTLWS